MAWRINREVSMESEGEVTWLTVADGLVVLSFLVLIAGVFVAPLTEAISVKSSARMFGVALMLFAASPFVLAGHYDLYCSLGKRLPRPRVTKQEITTLGLLLLPLGGGIWWIFA